MLSGSVSGLKMGLSAFDQAVQGHVQLISKNGGLRASVDWEFFPLP